MFSKDSTLFACLWLVLVLNLPESTSIAAPGVVPFKSWVGVNLEASSFFLVLSLTQVWILSGKALGIHGINICKHTHTHTHTYLSRVDCAEACPASFMKKTRLKWQFWLAEGRYYRKALCFGVLLGMGNISNSLQKHSYKNQRLVHGEIGIL